MNQETELSIIIPVYNVEPYLRRGAASVLRQKGVTLEVILVDDGSTDESGRLCDEIAGADSRVRVIHKANGGLSSARNAGLELARGTYVTFVDSDDWVEPDCYETALHLMKQYGVDLLCGGRYDVDADTGEKRVGLCPERTELLSGEEMAGRIFLWDHCDSSACDKVFHRRLFNRLRFPEGVVSEDVPVIYQAALKAERVLLWDRPYYCYYHRKGSITTAAVSEKTFHFSRHARAIEGDIRRNHPAIANQARFLLVRSLSHLLLMLIQGGPAVRSRYAREMGETRRELGTHLGFILTSPYFAGKERLRDLLLASGLYRTIYDLKHKG